MPRLTEFAGRLSLTMRDTYGLECRRITAILENALLEDRATRDATSYACIDPNQRASATIIAKQDCILAGIGCVSRILDVYAALDGAVTSHYEVTSHPEIFDGVRLHNGAVDRGDPAQRAGDSFLRARDSEFSAAHERDRDPDPQVCGCGVGHQAREFSIRARPRPDCA